MATEKTSIPAGVDGRVLQRLLEEGYGPGAWHGADLRAAIGDVSATEAFWRPQPDRHNIAEIALHHAWCVRNVRIQLAGTDIGGRKADAFVLEGEDWFPLGDGERLSWPKVQAALEKEQRQLADIVAAIASGRLVSPVDEAQRFDLALGVTSHAIYHAGQIQLIKVMRASQ